VGGASSAWGDTTIFSASAVAELSVASGASNLAITSTNATISGGSMYVYNGQTSAKNLIVTSGFQFTNGDTFFKIVFDQALQAGDKINAKCYNNNSSETRELGIWLTTATSRPGSAPTASITESIAKSSTVDLPEYTVAENDGICGETTIYMYRATGKNTIVNNITITRAAAAPGAVSFSPAAGSVAEGSSITLTSSGATTIVYQWGASAVGDGGDWSSATTYSDSNKPVVPAVGSTNTVLSVKATNANGPTYGSATYTPVKMALKTIYSFADGIGSQEVTTATASVETSPMSLGNTAGRIKLTAATGSQFKNGDAIEFSGSIGNTSKAYGIKYGPETSLGTNLFVAAGQPCYVSGTLTLDAATNDLYIGRYDGSTTNFSTFTIRQLTAVTSEGFTGAVKINGSAAMEGVDYTKEGNVYTLTAEFGQAPTVSLVNHIVFADESEEDQNVLVVFGNPDGEYFTGTAEIDGTTYTVKAPCGQINALKVVYKDGDTTVKEENITVTSSMKAGSSYTVPFRMYVEKDGALYKTTANSSTYYGETVTLAYNTTVTKSVNSVDLGGGTLVLFEDLDDSNSDGASTRASNCSAYINKGYTSPSNLPAGKYNFIFRVENINNRGSYIKVGDTEVYQTNSKTKGAWNDVEVNDVIIPTAGALTLAKSGSAYDGYDILIAICTSVTAKIGTTGWTTFASASPLNLSGMTASEGDVNAYYASAASTSTVTMKLTTATVPAGEGLMLKGTAGATITIPVAASGTAIDGNLLKGCTTSTALEVNATSGYNNYVLVNNGGTAEFQSLAENGATIPAGKAYLQNGTYSAGARLSIVFEEDATAIKAVDASVKSGAQADGKYLEKGKIVIVKNGTKFNANGQRMK
jgi:hypothetical protein